MPRRLLFVGLFASIILILGCGSAMATTIPEPPASSSLSSSSTNANTTKSASNNPTAEPTAEPTATPRPETTIIKGGNFRAGPGTDFDILQTLDAGTAVNLVRTKLADDGGRWFYVSVGDREGWIHSVLLGLDGTTTFDLPVDTQTYVAPTPRPEPTAVPAPPPAASKPRLRYDPFGLDRDCGDFSTYNEAYAFFIAAGGPNSDPHRLDGDNDGIPCESLP